MPALAKDTHMANNKIHPGMPRGHILCEEGPGEAVLTVLELYWNAGRANRTRASIISRLELSSVKLHSQLANSNTSQSESHGYSHTRSASFMATNLRVRFTQCSEYINTSSPNHSSRPCKGFGYMLANS